MNELGKKVLDLCYQYAAWDDLRLMLDGDVRLFDDTSEEKIIAVLPHIYSGLLRADMEHLCERYTYLALRIEGHKVLYDDMLTERLGAKTTIVSRRYSKNLYTGMEVINSWNGMKR